MTFGRVEVKRGFLLLMAWIFYCDTKGIMWLTMVACLCHEFGHLFVLHYFRQRITKITLTPFGAQIIFENTLAYPGELLSAVAGPAVNLFLSSLFYASPRGKVFAGINLILGIFNLLPVGTLDGARSLRSLIFMACDTERAERLSEGILAAATVCLVGLGMVLAVFVKNITLLLVCLWVLGGNDREKHSKKSAKVRK